MIFKPKDIQKIAEKLKKNQIGILPCDTVFGLCGLINTKNLKRILEIKQKPPHSPLLITIPYLKNLPQYTLPLNKKQKEWVEKNWPGPITFIFKAKDTMKEYCAKNHTIAIRYPEFLPFNYLLEQLNEGLLSTSANTHQKPLPLSQADIEPKLRRKCDFVYTELSPLYKEASTIVDISTNEPKIIRQGAQEFVT